MGRSGSVTLAWLLGAGGALACCAGAAVALSFQAPLSFLLVYIVGILMGILGALVVAREPHNPIGWLMCATALCASLLHLPAAYAFQALVVHGGTWPLASFSAWIAAWAWVPLIGFLPPISIRFPDGKPGRYLRVVDWIVAFGIVLFALGIALLHPARSSASCPCPALRFFKCKDTFMTLWAASSRCV